MQMDPPEEIDYGLEGDSAFPRPEEMQTKRRQTPPKIKDVKAGGGAAKEAPRSSGSYQIQFDTSFMGHMHKVFPALGSLSELFGQPDPSKAGPLGT